MANIPSVLIIAGTDPTGAAGITIDIKTLCYFDVHPAIAISAINVQNNYKVDYIHPTPAYLLEQQIVTAIEATNLKIVKIGMIYSFENIVILESLLSKYKLTSIFDPVLKSSSNYSLSEIGLENSINNLLSNIDLLTPNLIELANLTNSKIARNNIEAIGQAKLLINKYNANSILIKGGHSFEQNNSTDILCGKNIEPYFFSMPRLNKQKRGTGCALSTAIAANLAKNYSLVEAIKLAKEYINKYIAE